MLRLRGLHKTYAVGANGSTSSRASTSTSAPASWSPIMGASGSGKSTLLNVLGLLDDYDAGEYWLDGKLMKDLSETRAAVLRGDSSASCSSRST